MSHAQHNASVPPASPAANRDRLLPPAPKDGAPGPGPRGERPSHPPRPPRPEEDQAPAQPVDPQAASAAVKTANDALGSLGIGQVWTRTAPRGEQQVQATLMFQSKEAARLEFDPIDGSLLTRGQHLPPPPDGPGAGPREQRRPATHPDEPVPPASADANETGDAPVPAAPIAPVPAAPVNLDPIKGKLPEFLKGLSAGQGAEVMPREGFWKVPLIYRNRVVGELRLSGDGAKVIQDFGASRDAAVFAR